jgi:hypothetical protein
MSVRFAVLPLLLAIGCGVDGRSAPIVDDEASVSARLSDEFNDPSTLSSWQIANRDLATSLDIAVATPGNLTIVPRGLTRNAWYADDQAPFVYKSVTGNFVAEISVRIASIASSDPNASPIGQFNSGGFVVRDPSSAGRAGGSPLSSPIGHASWVMYNMGFQVNGFAREAKTTIPGSAGSLSTLYLNATPSGVNSGRLRICRIGSTLHMYHMHAFETAWNEEALTRTTQRLGNGASMTTPGVSGGFVRFARADLPATLEVGVVGNAWGAPFQTRAEFDYIRFGAANQIADCTAAIATPL